MKRHLPFAIIVMILLSLMIAAPLMSSGKKAPFIYVFPGPESESISPYTSLIFREGGRFEAGQLESDLFLVEGSRSGKQTGTLTLSTDNKTVIYYPDHPFAYNEVVSIGLLPGLTTTDGVAIEPFSHDFQTLPVPVDAFVLEESTLEMAGDAGPLRFPQYDPHPSQASGAPTYITRPDFSNTMPLTVTVAANETAAGLVFLTNIGFLTRSDPGLFILDDQGDLVYLKLGTPGKIVTDFKVQVVSGVPYLVYHEGDFTPLGWSAGKHYVMDNSYTVVDVWEMQHGYSADMHELQLLENGNALLLAYVPIPMDLTPYGGPANGIVVESVIQEVDAAKNVVLEWHSLDHVPLTETNIPLYNSPVDYMHSNAIEIDTDGNILVSNRNTSSIIKIDRDTGETIWSLGGKSNQFNFINDEGFSAQHDIRRLANGHITVFDNGTGRQPFYSRAVEYAIDESAKTISRVWRYPDTQDVFAGFMGNAQRLSNGNTMIGWGSASRIEEVKPDGSTALEMTLEGMTYRAFRQEWEGMPGELPLAAVRSMDDSSVMLYTSWNGATQITGYELYAGDSVPSLAKITTVAKDGFETAVELTGLTPDTCVFRVQPVHATEGGMPFSSLAYRIDQPGCLDLLTYKDYLPVSLYR